MDVVDLEAHLATDAPSSAAPHRRAPFGETAHRERRLKFIGTIREPLSVV